MDNEWKNLGRVTVERKTQYAIWEFKSLGDAVGWLGRKESLRCRQHPWRVRVCESVLRYVNPHYAIDGSDYLFRDECGLLIPAGMIHTAALSVTPYHRYRYRSHRFVFRNGPVENIRCRRGGGWRWSGNGRKRFLPEVRGLEAFHLDEDLNDLDMLVKARKRRSSCPWWDRDWSRSDARSKSWKKFRDKQWRPC